MKNLRWFAAGISVAIIGGTGLASAQAKADGFALDSFEPSDRGSDWFSFESPGSFESPRPTVGFVFDYAHKPLVFYLNDEEAGAPISDQVYLHIGGSVAVADRVKFGLSMPVALHHDGETGNVGGIAYETKSVTSAGDLRLSSHIRLFGNEGGPIIGSAGLLVHLPTGNQEAYVSDGKVRAEPRLQVAGDVGPLTYAGRLGVLLRARNENYLGRPFGSALMFGLAAGPRLLDGSLVIGPELYGSTVVSDGGDGFFEALLTPVDLLFGGHYTADDRWRVGLGAGPGLTRGWGSPDYRIVASLEFVALATEPEQPPPADRDKDTIADAEDACPDVPGEASADAAKHGCPPVPDRDGDGIADAQDACPDKPGPSSTDFSKNGCPPSSDRDSDKITDEQDACPDQPGEPNEDRTKHGCPVDPDRDKDGINNESDACPDQAGPAQQDPKKNGCPKAAIVGSTIQILERVEFDTAESTLRPESDSILGAVVSILETHPEIKKLSVEGHTDNRGTRNSNRALSRQRAAAVVDWLVRRGIEKARLTSQGFGPDKPAVSNTTDEGRQINRRVEFLIVERDEAQ